MGGRINLIKTKGNTIILPLFLVVLAIRITLLGRSAEDIAKGKIPDHLRAQNTRKHMKDSFIHAVLLLVQIVRSSNQKMDGLSWTSR
ncbi:hypothetical protein ACJIZ3_002438 [Penstemon smallii]|uniref:Uncharacterized protein n=1 Tax=Penstemon smallii TaxID=265156 RepID=A0ABD3U9C8_9LAMI